MNSPYNSIPYLILSGVLVAPMALADGVQSGSAVGYINMVCPPGYSLISDPLLGNDPTLSGILELSIPLPDGTRVYRGTADGLVMIQYDATNQQFLPADRAAQEIFPGEGFFIYNPSGAPFTLTFAGEVMQGTLTNKLPAGLSLRASIEPADGTPEALGLPAEPGDQVFEFDSGTQKYSSHLFDSFENRWIPPLVPLHAGDGFYLSRAHAGEWVQVFHINQ